jgi:hypothetical protein
MGRLMEWARVRCTFPGALVAVRSVGMAALTVARWFRRRRFRKWNAAATVIARAWASYKRRCYVVSVFFVELV